MLDANFNRAREAARVLEDYARLGLDDRPLAESAKRLRHSFAEVFGRYHLNATIRSRDIEGDVGTRIEAPDEYQRASAVDVAVAAGRRLSEALRVLEECGKTIYPGLAQSLEQMRYRGYELERQLAVRIDAPRRFGQVRLYVIITASLCSGDWLETADAAIDGGADALQLRENSLPDRELLERARRLVELCQPRGVLCVINDRPDIAALAGADGVHVGQRDLPVAEARRIVGSSRIIGCSTHTVEQARSAVAASPDYIAVGPMFASPTKPSAGGGTLAGPETLAAVARLTSLPLVAIGGISADRIDELEAAGGRCVCVCSAVIAADDVASAAGELKRRLTAAALQPEATQSVQSK